MASVKLDLAIGYVAYVLLLCTKQHKRRASGPAVQNGLNLSLLSVAIACRLEVCTLLCPTLFLPMASVANAVKASAQLPTS
jgi:hypothetical protein